MATDALIGTFADTDDPQLRQNRCFLYHVVGNGTGRWDVPVGGMGALSAALTGAAEQAGAELRFNTPVVSIGADAAPAWRWRRQTELHTRAAPAGQRGTRGARRAPGRSCPGARTGRLAAEDQLLLSRLPRLRDETLSGAEAFAGTFHVNESYEQLRVAYAEAASGRIPDLPPCEAYCHSLTDASILAPQLRAAGVHTLTVFGLHMPARLFRADHDAAKHAAVRRRCARSIRSSPSPSRTACCAR